jgi:carboxypeptidase Taq
MEADELTYSAHIVHRYELEKKLLSGELAVRHLPEAWNAGMESRLGVRPAHDAEGCLQDIHWAVGSFGYFPSYALGSGIAAQLFEAMRADLPETDRLIERGEFAPLLGWLREHVHAEASRYSLQELLQRATGRPLGAQALLRYLESKYLAGSARPETSSAAA